MIDETTQLLSMLNKKSQVTTLVGTFVSASTTGCVVDVGGGRIPARFATSYLPEINEPILIWFIDGNPFVVGPALTKPGAGVVVSTGLNMVTLTTDYGQVTVPYAATLTPTAGQVMKLSWQDGGFAHSVMSTSPTAGQAPQASGAGVTVHADKFTAVDAGSYGLFNSRWWTGEVYASDSNRGAWFYGSTISDTIPATANVSRVQLYVSPAQISGGNPNFALHAYQSKPSGQPSYTGTTPVAITSGLVDLDPAVFGNALKAGGGSFGVGLNQGGYNVLRSLADDGQSGALIITSTY